MAKNSGQKENEIHTNLLRKATKKKFKIPQTTSEEMKEKPVAELVEELRIYQVELEMQNEELKKNQMLLEESRDKYVDLYDFAPVGYFIFTNNGIITEVNLTSGTILGIERNKLLNQRFRQFVSPGSLDEWDRHIHNVLKHDEKQTCELLLLKKDGQTIYVRLDSIQLHSDNEKAKIRTAMSDITERKLSEEALKKSNNKFINLVSNIPGFIAYVNADTLQYEFVNDAFEKSFGIPKEKIIGSHIKEIISDKNYQFASKHINEVKSGKSVSYENSFDLVSGKHWLQVNYTPVFDTIGKVESIVVLSYDITERKQAEESLRLQGEITKNLTEGVYLIRFNDGIIIYANPKFENMFGYDPGELIGKEVSIVNAPAERTPEDTKNAIMDILNQKGEWHGEIRNIKKDGTQFYCYANVSIFDHPQYGKVLVSTHTDITKRKQIEASLKESEERFKLLFEKGSISMALTDESFNFVKTNNIFVETMEYSEDELKSMTFKDITHPDYIEQDKINIQKLMNKEIDVYRTEKRYITKTQKIIWGSVQVSIIRNQDGKFINFLIYINDITERKRTEEILKESEERLRRAIVNSPIPIIIHDEDDQILLLSAGWTKYSGYTIEDIPTLADWAEIAYGERSESTKEYIDHLFFIDQTVSNGEWIITAKDGSKRIWDFQTTPLGRANRGKRVLHSIAIDITERKNAEQEILESKEQLRLLAGHLQEIREEERTRIAREIHDDLGHTLSGLKLDVILLKKKITSQEYSTENIQTDFSVLSDSIDTIISSVIRISTELRPGVLDYLGLKTSIEWQADEFEKKTEIKCKCMIEIEDFEISTEKTVSLFRILQESLTNIMRHAKASEVIISLDQDEENIMLKVTDNGIGINDQSISDYKSLGLLGMRERTVLMKGKFEIYRQLNSGTVVEVSVPKDKKPKSD